MKMILPNSRIRFVLSFFFVLTTGLIFAQNFSGTVPEQQPFEEKCAATYIEKKQPLKEAPAAFVPKPMELEKSPW